METHDGGPIGIARRVARHHPPRCERTGLTIPECSCPLCWARIQAREEVRRIVTRGSTRARHVIDAGIG
jgi:hypothetical protein